MPASSDGQRAADPPAYRPDIDGLRAVAVLAVVVYHLNPTMLAGGYLGVDIFFVISGYLITAIIRREIGRRSFSIWIFYNRRIRRIMPALLVVLFVTTIASAFVLLPSDLIDYGHSLIATLLFVSNVYFWRETNYFSHGAAEKPLLHLWSLGVEEQFYILFPISLYLLARFVPRWTVAAVALVTALSFGLNVFALTAGGDSPAFFLIPTRAWELGAGSLLAFVGSGAMGRVGQIGVWQVGIGLAGAALVVLGLVAPLIWPTFVPVATPAVIGAVLVIAAGAGRGSPVTVILSSRPAVFIGLISYSLYLWHWPVIVLARYYEVRDLTPVETLAVIVVLSCAAVLSWRFVERPTRDRGITIGRVRLAAASGAVVLAVAAAGLIGSRGLPARMNAEAASINAAYGTIYKCPVTDFFALGAWRACVLNLPSRSPDDAAVVLFGNSHALMYAPVWREIMVAHRQKGFLLPANGCLPTVTVNVSADCQRIAEGNLASLIGLPRVTTVVIAVNWAHAVDEIIAPDGRVLDNRHSAALTAGLDDLVTRLTKAGKHVILIGPIAEPGWDVASIVSRDLAFGHPPDRPTFVAQSAFLAEFGGAIRHFAARRDMVFVRADAVQCRAGRCDYIRGGQSLFADGGHIAIGALPAFHDMFEAAFTRAQSPS